MANISKITIGGVTYDIEDGEARRILQLQSGGLGVSEGSNLEEVFADEIAATHGLDQEAKKWNWIRQRIRNSNFAGLFVGDYIPFTISQGDVSLKAEIAGINTYKNYGDTGFEVGNHIDFITRDCHPAETRFNIANFNNGTTVSPAPWLSSELYAKLNNLQMQVPSVAGATPTLITADFRSNGVYGTLPSALRDVIVQKRALIPRRHSAGVLLIDDTSWGWADIGYLWIPSEMEVYGTNVWGSLVPATPGNSIGGFQQYPIFANNMKRVKHAGEGGPRSRWWLLSARGGSSTHFCSVHSIGHANHDNASTATLRVPLCFRIA